jgi:4-amino-4-deoxy-L-arabinose transferase-like glycosyltransferase
MADHDRRLARSALLVTLGVGALRLVVAALTPLFPDETYYWDWSRHLAPGYFDHPPMIAWMIRAGRLVAGDTPLGVRLLPVLAGVAAALFVSAAARRIAGDAGALLAAIVFAAMPLSAGLVLATPDAPLLCFLSATTYALVRVLEHPPRSRPSLAWWCVAGAALGLALDSKYTAALFAFGVFLGVAIIRPLRARLLDAGPYLATLIAFVVFLPVVAWNARHDWTSFDFQLRHGLGVVAGSPVGRVLEMLGGQLALVSPILFVLLAIAIVAVLARASTPTAGMLAIASAFVFAFFLYSATKRRVEANWPAIAYVPGTVVLAAAAATWSDRRRWIRGGIVLGALLTLVAFVNAFVPVLPVPARRDPAARAHGWDDLARAVDAVHAPRLPISSRRTFVAGDRYQEASALAFHLPNRPETFSLNLASRPNQYDLWPTFRSRASPRDGLILVVDDVPDAHPAVELLRPHFSRVTRGDPVTLARRGDAVKFLRIWVLDGWLGTWPESQLRSR